MTASEEGLNFKPVEAQRMAKVFSGFGMPRMKRKATLSDLKVVLAKLPEPEEEEEVDDQACQVLVRCRPPMDRNSNKICTFIDEPTGRGRYTLTLQPPESEPSVKKPRPFRCHKYMGPDTPQDEIFDEGEWVVERAMEGYNSTVLCYGITGSGKSYTMFGPSEEELNSGQFNDKAEEIGIIQRVGAAIFEYIRDHSLKGEVFAVEIQCLEVCTEDGMKEKLIDLLAQDEKKLELKPDAFNTGSYVCEGLTSVSIRSPDDMIEVLSKARSKVTEVEQKRMLEASRSHVAMIISVENLKEEPGCEPVVQRGKLALVDLAGSESLKYVQTQYGTADHTFQRQAIAINRVLASLASAVNSANEKAPPSNHRESALTLLLKDCVGANARVLLVANISPEFALMEETSKTLTFAQQMIAAKDTAVPTEHRINKEQSSLMNMRDRHAECIRILHEKAIDTNEQQAAERSRLQAEFEDLNKRLLTAESAANTLENMKNEQMRKFDEIRNEVASTMTAELQSLRKQSVEDMEFLRKSLTQSSDDKMRSLMKEHDERLQRMQKENEELRSAKRAAEEQASQFKMKLSSCEQELKYAQSREEQLRREVAVMSEERRELRQQADQLWQKVSSTEADLHRAWAEGEVQRSELNRVQEERDQLKEKEANHRRESMQVQRELEDTKRDSEMQGLRHESEQRELASLRERAQRYEVEVTASNQMMEKLRAQMEKVEEERDAGKRREEDLKEQFAEELQGFQAEIEESRQRELELLNLLQEVQQSVLVAADG